MSIHQYKKRFVLDEDYRYVYEQTKPEERDPCKFCSECTVFQRVAKDWCQDKLLFMDGTNFEFTQRQEDSSQTACGNVVMKCRDLMDYLKKFNPDQKIVLFDENSHPMEIKKVVIDSANDGYFNHIVVNHIEVS